MTQYNIIAEQEEYTVVSAYKAQPRPSETYQSEAALENAFIKQLESQGYTHLPLHNEEELIRNLRCQLELLNHYDFSDEEWKRLFGACIANATDGIAEKTRTIQEDYIKSLQLDDGTFKNIYLIDKENIHNNSLQVINQYVPDGGAHANRYDVTILVNGLPLVHVELKRRGVSLKESFNQINRYNRESFWAGCGLFEFVQLFVISNGTETKYYSNTTRDAHINEVKKNAKAGKQQTSNSYEFTSYWADRDNRTIRDLVDFTATFLAKHTLLNVLTRYCVFTSEQLLLVMRPYQIAATESIINRIETSTTYHKVGKVEAGGYIWHTTGSGKTLTSFKTAQLASRLPIIDKVLFVVDRKDLDYQTMKEYDRFEKGAANSNRSTAVLTRQLEDDNARIIITTIQKLSVFIKKNDKHDIYGKHVVIIFDECHRSQFGEMHRAIVKKFKRYHLFGFTGTPIFPENAGSLGKNFIITTAQAFGDQLHIYTIVDAIKDQNVLPFKVEYHTTMRYNHEVIDEQVPDIDRQQAFMAPQRISNVVQYILEHFDQKTKRNSKAYAFNKLTNITQMANAKAGSGKEEKSKVHLMGFNSIFAVESIPLAKRYYEEFKRQQAERPPDKRLRVGLIYSYQSNEDLEGEENNESTEGLDKSSRDFLESAIADYNQLFGTTYDTSGDLFQNYYKDVSLRMKNRELDLLIVVNMFLTGFDATTLNTLWVDKNLRMHGLLQAFSRTNRILNSVKTVGNIVCFRNLEKATNESIGLFGDKEAGGVIVIRPFKDYYKGYKDDNGEHHPGYCELMEEMKSRFPYGQEIIGETEEKAYIKLYGTLLRADNLLKNFDEFAESPHFTEGEMQDYQSIYISLYEKYRKHDKADAVVVNDDIVFEMELARQIEVNIDYILYLVEQLHKEHTNNREVMLKVKQLIDSGPDLRDKRDLIMNFIQGLQPHDNITEKWIRYADFQRTRELEHIITQQGLKREETYAYMKHCFDEGEVIESGTEVVKILPPLPLFGRDSARSAKKAEVLTQLKAFFNKYHSITGSLDATPRGFSFEEAAALAAEGNDTMQNITIENLHIHGDIWDIHDNKIE